MEIDRTKELINIVYEHHYMHLKPTGRYSLNYINTGEK